MGTDQKAPALWPSSTLSEQDDPDELAIAYASAIAARGGHPKIELATQDDRIVGIVVYDSACKGLPPRKFPTSPMTLSPSMREAIVHEMERQVGKLPIRFEAPVSAELSVEDAEREVKDAVNLVARSARELSDNAVVRHDDWGPRTGHLVDEDDMKDLREQLARWNKATEAFLKACHKAGG